MLFYVVKAMCLSFLFLTATLEHDLQIYKKPFEPPLNHLSRRDRDHKECQDRDRRSRSRRRDKEKKEPRQRDHNRQSWVT